MIFIGRTLRRIARVKDNDPMPVSRGWMWIKVTKSSLQDFSVVDVFVDGFIEHRTTMDLKDGDVFDVTMDYTRNVIDVKVSKEAA